MRRKVLFSWLLLKNWKGKIIPIFQTQVNKFLVTFVLILDFQTRLIYDLFSIKPNIFRILIVLKIDLLFGNYIRICVKVNLRNRVESYFDITIKISLFLSYVYLFKNMRSNFCN